MRRMAILVASLALINGQTLVASAQQLNKPNIVKMGEIKFPNGSGLANSFYVQISDKVSELSEFKTKFGVKSYYYQCQTSSGNCSVIDWWINGEEVTSYIYVRDYLQGSLLKVRIDRYLTLNNGNSLNSFVNISDQTLNISPRPVRGPVTPEVGGCSFDILNFDKNFEYFFKSFKAQVSKTGHVTLYPYPGASTIEDYVSIARKGYTLINATETYISCQFLT